MPSKWGIRIRDAEWVIEDYTQDPETGDWTPVYATYDTRKEAKQDADDWNTIHKDKPYGVAKFEH